MIIHTKIEQFDNIDIDINIATTRPTPQILILYSDTDIGHQSSCSLQ